MADIKTYNIGNIETAQFFYQSLDYQTLEKNIAKQQKMVRLLEQAGEIEDALVAARELEDLQQQLEQFKETVFRLYETFTKIEISSERLAQAKAHFDRGEFREADAILNATDMARDLTQLMAREQQIDREKADIEQQKGQIANEYVIKAQLRAIDYDQPNRFEQSCEYFEQALRAARTPEILFEYALFLQNHNCFDPAKLLYIEALQSYRELEKENPRTFLPNVATTLNNLAVLQADQNDYARAIENYTEALQIRRSLAAENPHTFLPSVATTLNNLANLQSNQNDYASAVENYTEALQTYRSLAAENPHTFLPSVATTLNNLANLQSNQNDYASAAKNYSEALQIRRSLAAENPRTFLPDVAMTLINLSIFYLEATPDREQSIALAVEVLEIAQQFPQVAIVQRYAETAVWVLRENGVEESG